MASGSGGDWRILLFDITLGGAEEILLFCGVILMSMILDNYCN